MPRVSCRGLLGRTLTDGDVTLDELGAGDELLVVAGVLVCATVVGLTELGEPGWLPVSSVVDSVGDWVVGGASDFEDVHAVARRIRSTRASRR